MPCPPAVRVIVRLPYNRPEDAPLDLPRVEWTAEKEKMLWEVIAHSRAIEGAATDWKGLAEHLRVPLPYILYRAQARYEEDLRGLQGLGIRSPPAPFPSAFSPQRTNVQGEYFPRVPDSPLPPLPLRDVAYARMGSPSSATDGLASTSGTVPSTSTLRPLGVRARLSSLGIARAHAQVRSPVHADPVHSPLAGLPTTSAAPPLRQTKKISSSSTITLQGPRRTRTPLHRLSPTSSRADSSSDDSDLDEQTRKEEEAERQETLTRKLQDLKNMMTTDTLGLVADPARTRAKQRGRARPISGASTSAASLSSSGARRSSSMSRSHGQQSLSSASVDSRQGSIPSLPSPPASAPRPAHLHRQPHPQSRRSSHPQRPPMRPHSQSQSTSQSLSHSRSTTQSNSSAQPPSRVTSPMPVPRHLSTPSTSPPALSPGRAVGQTHVQNLRYAAAGLAAVSGTVSEASSFSDLSDTDLSGSALESALMSNTRGGGSR
ncbi:hypothetical protein TRAPUB_13157, partial [Trametes pubescens]